MARANVELTVNAQGAVGPLRSVQQQAGQTQTAVKSLQNAVTGLVGAFSAAQAIRFVFAKTAELETQTRSLQVLTGSVQQAKQIIEELQQLGAVTPFTSTELIDAAKRLQAFGVEGDRVVEVTRRLADASGATGAELQGLVTAYGQVVAKGRLQGEELLQFQERGVGLQQELQKMYKLSGKELQDALSKGRISAEAVEVAIRRLTSAGGKYANGAVAQSDTLAGRFSTLQDGIDQLARRLGQVLTPALKSIFNQAIAAVDAVNQALAAGRGGGFSRSVFGARQALNVGATSQAVDNIAKGIGQINAQKNKTGIQQNLQALQQYQRLLQSIGADDRNASRAEELQGLILQKIDQNIAAQKELNKQTQAQGKIFDVPPLAAPDGKTGGGRTGASAAERAAKQAAEREKEIQERLRGLRLEQDLIKQTGTAKQLQYEAERAGDKQLLIRLQAEEEINTITNQLAATNVGITDQRLIDQNIQKATLEIANVQAQTERQLAEEKRAANQRQMDDMKKFIEQQYEMNTAIKQQRALADGIASVVGQNMTTAFDALISGAKSWQQSLQQIASGVLVDIAKQLLQIFVIEQAINAIRSFLTPFNPATPLGAGGGTVGKYGTLGPNYGIPQRAKGGSVMGGQSYLVGERGPELFTPGRTGSVAPNGSFGSANIVVNVDAKGTQAQGNQPNSAALGRAIGAAVQAELIKQKRPGGLLA